MLEYPNTQSFQLSITIESTVPSKIMLIVFMLTASYAKYSFFVHNASVNNMRSVAMLYVIYAEYHSYAYNTSANILSFVMLNVMLSVIYAECSN
jgi:hypothetical protein